MHITDCWALLEIVPTKDLKEIRRAYARKLKTIDVLADPAAFVALREAYETTRAATSPNRLGAHDLLSPEIAAPMESPRSPVIEAMEAVDALLTGVGHREAIFASLSAYTERLVQLSHAVDLEQSEWIEQWIAETIVTGIPRSNGMLPPAVTGFGWAQRAEDHDCPDAIITAVGRYDDFQFLQRFQALNPHYRTSWIVLMDGTADLGSVHAASMSTLLGVIQHQRPNLLDDIDVAQFRRWTDYLEEQRRIERRQSLLERTPPSSHSARAAGRISPIGYIALGLSMILVAALLLASPAFLGSGYVAAILLAMVGSVFVIIGREGRVPLKKRIGPTTRRKIRQ